MEQSSLPLKTEGAPKPHWTMNICVVAAEASGDVNAALLIEALQKCPTDPEQAWHFWGIAGPKMRQVGVEDLATVEELSVMGFAEVLGEYVRIRGIHRALEVEIIKRKPALLILVDAPSFNLRLAEFAHSLGIIVHYHIPPKVWVHGQGRVEILRNCCHLVTCVLPFEEEFLRNKNVPALYVGHPLQDSVRQFRDSVRAELGEDKEKPTAVCAEKAHKGSFDAVIRAGSGWTRDKQREGVVHVATAGSTELFIGLLPGSRKSEVRAHLATLIQAFHQLRQHFAALPPTEARTLVALIPVAETLDKQWFAEKLAEAMQGVELPNDALRVMHGAMHSVLDQVDYAWVCSGTATLETCFFEVPHAVFYKTSWFTYQIAKRIVRVPFASLVNLVAGRELTPELLQAKFTAENLVNHARGLLSQPAAMQAARRELHEVSMVFKSGSAGRAANAVIQLMGFWSAVPVTERIRSHRILGMRVRPVSEQTE